MGRPVLGSVKRAIVFGVTALLILGGAAYALAKSSGGTITVCVSHEGGGLYKAKKCAKHDKKLSWNARGRAGPKGSTGATGVHGPPGARGAPGAPGNMGAQGPGGTMLTYDNTAGASPTLTTLGTVLGDTISAQCTIPTTGEAELIVVIKTSDGSLNWGYDFITDNGGVIKQDASEVNAPAGTYAKPTTIDLRTAAASTASDGQLEINQIGPSPGYMVWHELATTKGPQSCHFSVMAFPTTITSTSTKPGAGALASTHGPIDLTDPGR